MNRAAVILIDIHKLREERIRKFDVFTGNNAGTANRHACGRSPRVLGHHGLVRGETAGGKNHTAAGTDIAVTILGLDADTVNNPLRILKQLHNLGVEHHFYTEALCFLLKIERQLGARKVQA